MEICGKACVPDDAGPRRSFAEEAGINEQRSKTDREQMFLEPCRERPRGTPRVTSHSQQDGDLYTQCQRGQWLHDLHGSIDIPAREVGTKFQADVK